jgi:hypothetical protein
VAAHQGEQRGRRLDTLRLERGLEIGHERAAELRIRLRAGDEPGELAPRRGQLLSRLNPRLGGRREHPDQSCKLLDVVSAHRVTWSPDGSRVGFLPDGPLECNPKLVQTAGDPAGDGAGREAEGVADRAVALVPGEEPVEDLAAVLRQRGERPVDVEGLLQLREDVLRGLVGELLLAGLLPGAGTEAVDAEAAGELRDPGAQRLVVAERVEPFVDPGEDLLEDVFRVVRLEPEGLNGDRVDVARKAIYELAPGCLVPVAAAGDQRGVAELGGQVCCAARSRFAIVSSSFQAIEAFPSTRGRNSHAVRP